MQLTMINGGIANASVPRYTEMPDPQRVARYLHKQRKYSLVMSIAISRGALLKRRTTVALAQDFGLIAKDAVSDAVVAGLLK